MTPGIDMAAVAALVGDPGRANMLAALMDGRAHTATELTRVAGLQPPTGSGHLAKLARGRLVDVVAQGRHRYYRLASPEVARMLESVMVVAAEPGRGDQRATPRIDPAMRRARSCYDHLAGQLGVALADVLVAQGWIALAGDGAGMTGHGLARLSRAGLAPPVPSRGRPFCRPCLDWSERRPHLAGPLGALLLGRALAVGLVRRRAGDRALDVVGDTDDLLGRLGLA